MSVRSKLRALLFRKREDAEMSAEIRLHLELQTERNIAAGMNPDEARYAAQRQFGGVEQVKERCRDQRSWVWLEQWMRDLAHAARALRQAPGFSAVAIATLALVIGANSFVFSLVNGFSLKSVLPERGNVAVHVVALARGASRAPQRLTREDLDCLRANSTIFSAVAGYIVHPATWGPDVRELRHGMIERVTDGFFGVCGVEPALGRFFAAATASDSFEAVVSHRAWRTLGGGSAVLGRQVLIGGARYTIVGVAPRGFGGPTPLQSPDVWIPLPAPRASGPSSRSPEPLAIVARLAPGLKIEAASAGLGSIETQLNESVPAGRERELTLVKPSLFAYPGMPDRITGGVRVAGGLFITLGAVLLLIASLNLANLLLARGASRSREIAVRLALGATRWRVVRLLLSESLLLSMAGSFIGLVFAGWAGFGLEHWLTVAIAQRTGFTIGFDFTPDWRVLTATSVYGTLIMLAIGVAPALRSTRRDAIEDLKGAGDATRGTGRIARFFALRHVLVMGQIAGSLVLVVCAGLFLRFVAEKQRLDAGFDVARNAVFSVDYRLSGQDPVWSLASLGDDPAQSVADFRQRSDDYQRQLRRHREAVLDRVRALPGVREAAVACVVIFPNGDSEMRQVQAFGTGSMGDERATPPLRVVETAVSRQYFSTLGIPIVAGRGITAEEEQDGRRVAMIDEQLAERLFPHQPPIGQQVRLLSRRDGQESEPYEVIGIVRSPAESVRITGRPLRLYRSIAAREAEGSRTAQLYLHVAVTAPEAMPAVLAAVQRELSAIDAALPARMALPMREHIAANPAFGMLHLGASIFGALGGIGLLVAVVGIYGVKAHAVTQRTREIGVRLALGAEPAQLRQLFLREGLLHMIVALAVGLALAAMAGLGVSRVFDSVSSFDLPVTTLAMGLLGGSALLACWLPARRAAKVDPMVTLRCE